MSVPDDAAAAPSGRTPSAAEPSAAEPLAAERLAAEPLPAAAVPADALVLLIGPAGAGKSTWAAAHFPAAAVVSSDALRELVSGRADDQAATSDAFGVLHAIVRARLKRGLLTVVDATNVTAGARRSLSAIAARAGRPTVAIVFDLPLEQNIARNAARTDRVVPDDVVRRHHQQLRETLARLPDEGHQRIIYPSGEAVHYPSGGAVDLR